MIGSNISMSDIPGYTVLAAILGVSLYLLWNRRGMARCPGPRGFPLIGNIPQVTGGEFDKKLQKFRDQFGDIFRLQLGQMTTVFVFGLKNIEDVLLGKEEKFDMRPNWLYIPDKIIQKKGLIWTDGEIWQRMRDIVTTAQTCPASSQHAETLILAEVNHVVKLLSDITGSDPKDHAIDPCELFSASVFNVLSAFVLGQRFDEAEEDFALLKNGFKELTEMNKSQNPVNMFPILGKILTRKRHAAIAKEKEIFTILQKYLTSHSTSHVQDKPRDVMDTYLHETEGEQENKENLENNFLRSIVDMYIYGSEMTTSLLLWTVVFLVRYPDVQKKCQEEIDTVVGDRDVTSSDKASLRYCVAVLREVMRISGPGVMTPLHSNRTGCTIGGHTIAERSLVVCDLRKPRLDDEIWENPFEFQPGRFLSELNETQERVASLSFGLGPRCCPGQKLTETTHFLFCMNLIRHFRLHHDDETVPISLVSQYKGVSLKPRPFKVVFRPRDDPKST